jgi:hypothetical protein
MPKSLDHEQESGRKWRMDVRLKTFSVKRVILHGFDP